MHAFRKLWNKIKHFSCGLVAVISIAMISCGTGYSIASMKYEGESWVDSDIFKKVLEEHGYSWKSSRLMDIFTRQEADLGDFTVDIDEPFIEITRTYKVTFSNESDRRTQLLEIINRQNIRSPMGHFVLVINDAKTAILRVRFYTMVNLENLRDELESILMNINGICYDMEVDLKDRFEGATLLQIQDRDEISFISPWTKPISAPTELLAPSTPPSP